MQRGQCNIAVDGPEAFNGRVYMPDPMSSLNTVVTLAASRYLPPNDSSYTVEVTSGPQVANPNGGFRSLGTVTPVNGKSPAVTWNLNPAKSPFRAPSPALRSRLAVTGPLDIVYTIEDEWGNTSEGVLTPTLVPTVFPPANVNVISFDLTFLAGSNAVLPLNTPLQGTVIENSERLGVCEDRRRLGDRHCSTR